VTRQHPHYPDITHEAQMELITYCLLRAAGQEASLSKVLARPHGSISWAQIEEPGYVSTDPNAPAWAPGDGPRAAFKIGDRNPRYCDPEALAVLLVLTWWGGHAFFDNVSPRVQDPRKKEHHYIELLDPLGTRFHRLIAGAGEGEVALLPNHYDLRMQSLRIIMGKAQGDREDAIQMAMTYYHAAAVARGQSLILSASAYEALVRLAFKLLHDAHGHKLRGRDRESASDKPEAAE